jgi:hypothetical protein
MNPTQSPSESPSFVSWSWVTPTAAETASQSPRPSALRRFLTQPILLPQVDLIKPLRLWLDGVQISNPAIAHRICRTVPAQCPFERDITLFGRTILHIPPMCKLNPLYEEVVGLRFRALCYLADECGEDISCYC